mgnify:CR=1 FL=1
MGHIRLGTLSASKKWREVVALLEDGADLETIAASAAMASKRDLSRAADDPVFRFASRILVELPLMARSPDFGEYLQSLGCSTENVGSLPGVLSELANAINKRSREEGAQSDLGGMAKSALLESLSHQVSGRLPSLFEPTPQEGRRALASLSSGQNFAALAREFFARLTHRSLDYYLSREFANHTGPERRFSDDGARVAFQRALAQHTFEAAKIIEAFAGGWYGKTIWQNQALDQDAIIKFAAYSFKKMRSELGRRES